LLDLLEKGRLEGFIAEDP